MGALSFELSSVLQFAFGLGDQDSLLKYFCLFIFFCTLFLALLNIKCIIKNIRPIVWYFIILVLYGITSLIYGTKNALYESYYISMIAQMGPAVIVGILCASKKNYLQYVQKLILPFSLLFTVVIAVIEQISLITSAVHFSYGGFDYQVLSYYAALAYGLNLFLIFKFYNSHRNFLIIFLLSLLSLYQIYLTIVPGGRGAFVLLLVYSLFYFLNRLSVKSILYLFGFVILAILIFDNLPIGESLDGGSNRLLSFFGDSDAIKEDSRTEIYKTSFGYFLESPIWGNGLGSVWYLMGRYSHNIFLDLLLEGGLILFFIYIGILLRFCKKAKALLMIDGDVAFYLIIFIYSIVRLSFSCYYSADTGSWFALCAVLCNNLKSKNYSPLKINRYETKGVNSL